MAGRLLLNAETGGADGAWTELEPGVWKLVVTTEDASTLNIEARNSSAEAEHTLADANGDTLVLSAAAPETLYVSHQGGQVRTTFATDDGGPVTVNAHLVKRLP